MERERERREVIKTERERDATKNSTANGFFIEIELKLIKLFLTCGHLIDLILNERRENVTLMTSQASDDVDVAPQ